MALCPLCGLGEIVGTACTHCRSLWMAPPFPSTAGEYPPPKIRKGRPLRPPRIPKVGRKQAPRKPGGRGLRWI